MQTAETQDQKIGFYESSSFTFLDYVVNPWKVYLKSR